MATTDAERWPSIPVADWPDTRDTLHLYTQVVGKVRLANEPRLNHWWNVPLYVSARGLTTSLMPHPTGPALQIDFDFLDHRLDITTVTGQGRSLDLVPRPVAEFYATMSLLDELGVATDPGRCQSRSPTQCRSRTTGCTPAGANVSAAIRSGYRDAGAPVNKAGREPMRGWQFTEVDAPLKLNNNIPDPVPGPGELIIDTVAAGLCHSDLSYLDGTLTPLLGPAPIVLGHEFAGIVSQVGEGVEGAQVGDRVAINADVDGPGTLIDGGFATKVLVRDWEVVHIPDGVPWEQAAPATDAGRTAHHAVFTIGEVNPGTRLGIIGYGGLGSLGSLMAMAIGAEVYVAEINEEVRANALADGAVKAVTDVSELADDELDVIIDMAGFDTTTSGAIAAVKKGGRVVQVGLAKPTVTFNVQDLVLHEVQLHGSVTGSTEDLAAVLNFIKEGAIKSRVEKLSFEEIGPGYDRMKRGDYQGRLVAMFDHPNG